MKLNFMKKNDLPLLKEVLSKGSFLKPAIELVISENI